MPGMRRRDFVALLGGSVAAWPLAARAQQPTKIPRVGLLSTFSPSETRPWHQALRQGLRDLGWVEGENISIEYRYAEGRLDRLPGLASDLVRLQVDLILTDTTSPALAVKYATRTIPVVVASASDFVESGLVSSTTELMMISILALLPTKLYQLVRYPSTGMKSGIRSMGDSA